MSISKRLLPAALVATVFLAACDEQGNPIAMPGGNAAVASPNASAPTVSVARGKTAAERSLESRVANLSRDTRNIIVQNTVQGALAGAAAGCILAELTNSSCANGALAGGLLGGLMGNQVGQQAADVNQRLVKADETIARLTSVGQQLNSIEGDLRSVLRSQNSEIASLRRQLAAGQVRESAVNNRINAINSNRTAIVRGLEATEQNIVNERATLVSLERESGQSFSTERRAIDSSRTRVRNLRNTVALASG